jgi:dienelactone hydrolase
MKYFIYFYALTMAVSMPSFAETLKCLPIPTGPYQIGIAKYDLIDSARKEVEHPAGRLIPIQVYFPMQKMAHSSHKKIFEERTPGNWPPLDVEVYSQKADISSLDTEHKHPLILLNHGDTVAMTDYAFIAEDLASIGYIVVTIQHQLKSDPEEPKFWKERSISRYGKVIDNILFVFTWLQKNETNLFNNALDLKKIALIGHSMGGNSLLLFANRTSNIFKKKQTTTLLPQTDTIDVKEAIIVLDTGGFPYPAQSQYPLFLLLSEEREEYQKTSGTYDEMIKIGHIVKYYKGSKHISFMDHGYIDPQNPLDPNEHYFNGSLEQRIAFFDQIRTDIREFLKESGIK